MLQSILNLFGFGPKIDFAQLKKSGAIILDVRTKSEYAHGHIPQSINIAVDQLLKTHNQLGNKEVTIITCCASGMRSGIAKKYCYLMATYTYIMEAVGRACNQNCKN
jgi:phage shock protein E